MRNIDLSGGFSRGGNDDQRKALRCLIGIRDNYLVPGGTSRLCYEDDLGSQDIAIELDPIEDAGVEGSQFLRIMIEEVMVANNVALKQSHKCC